MIVTLITNNFVFLIRHFFGTIPHRWNGGGVAATVKNDLIATMSSLLSFTAAAWAEILKLPIYLELASKRVANI